MRYSLLSCLFGLLFITTVRSFLHGPRGSITTKQPIGYLNDSLLARKAGEDPPAATKKKAKKVVKKAEVVPEKVVEKVETFKKADFVAAISAKTGMSKKDSEMAMQAVLDTVVEQVGAGKRVGIPGFGIFSLKNRAARKGRNPQTGEEIDIPASKSPGFTPAKAWKDIINGKA